MPQVFLSYRQDDAPQHAMRIQRDLAMLGRWSVVTCDDRVRAGAEPTDAIEAIGSEDICLVLIGPRWLERDAGGQRRIDDPNDPVRRTIKIALDLIPVIPILVAGAELP